MKWLKYGVLGLAGLIALFLAAMAVMGHRADAGRIRAGIEIARPPEEVWKWIVEPDRFRQWVSWVTEAREEGPEGVGRRRVTIMKDPNMNNQPVRIDSVTRELIPARKLVVDLSSPLGFTGTMTYTLEESGAGRTRLSTDSVFQYEQWFAALLEPLVTPQAARKMEGDLRTLKRLTEQ